MTSGMFQPHDQAVVSTSCKMECYEFYTGAGVRFGFGVKGRAFYNDLDQN